MTVCRYFLQGYCRFGDRCRFEHTLFPRDNSSAYDNSGRHDYSYENQGKPQPAHSNYNQGRDRQYNDKYASNQQYHSSERSYQDSRRNYNEVAEPDYYANKYNRNKHTWVSDDYKKQDTKKTPRSGNERVFDTSTPKSKTAFSFRDADVQSSRDQPTDLHMIERNIIDAEIIKEDVLLWELGNQWPFTCYCPTQGKSAFPGFVDLSPEELRLEAYKAKENNTYTLYVESVEKALQEIKMKREQMKEPSVQLMSIIEKIRKGEYLISESVVDGNASSLSNFNQAALEDMVADETSLPHNTPASTFSLRDNTASFFVSQTSPASTFSFKATLATDEGPKNSASSLSFKVPSESGSKTSGQATSGDIYTPMDTISEQDKEQFSAPTFTLGKIPTVPPPHEMCF